MKKNDLFHTPSRQSQWAIVFIILRFVRGVLSQLWPIALAFFLGRNSSFDRYELLLSGVGVFGMIASVVAYFRYYFYISEEDFIIRSGLFKKVKLNIPFERIQSINFKQTLLHRLFRVTEIEIETAGSNNLESRLDALTLDKAERLRRLLLDKRDAAIAMAETDDPVLVPSHEIPKDAILTLSLQQLFKLSLTQNHLRLVGLIGSLVFSIYIYSFTLEIEVEGYYGKVLGWLDSYDMLGKLLLVIMIVILSVVFSIIVTIMKFYNLHFWRQGNKFQIVHGLLTKREFAALDNKIQMMNWGHNPLERWVGYYNIVFRQAKSGNRTRGVQHMFEIPGCDLDQVRYVADQWLNKTLKPYVDLQGVSPHYFIRGLTYRSIFWGLMIVLFAYFKLYVWIPVLIIMGLISIYLKWLKYRKLKYAYNGQELYIGGGILGHRHTLLPAYKIQNIRMRQAPYEWRRDLATLVIYTAAGSIKIPFIPIGTASTLLDQLIYQVERTQTGWM